MTQQTWARLPLGLLVLALLTAVDVQWGSQATLTGTTLLAPFLMAVLGGAGATAVVAAATVALGAASGEWNMNFGTTDYWLSLTVMVPACVFSVFAARARQDARLAMRRFELLNELADIADGSLALSVTMQRITELIVPELADFCMIDVINDGEATRVAVHAAGPRAEEVEAVVEARRPSVPENLLGTGRPVLLEPRHLPDMTSEPVIRDLARDEADFRRLRGLGMQSSITVPLSAREQVLGALTIVTASSGRHYQRDDVRFARVLGGRVALALDNAGLFSDLQSVERRMDTVMATLREAVIVHDTAGKLVYANDAAARLLGFESAEEAIATPPERIRDRYDIYDEQGRPLPVEDLGSRRILAGEERVTQIVRAINRETGEEMWRRTKARAIEGPDGRPLFVVSAIEDVTDIKRAQFSEALLSRTGELLASSIDHRMTMERVGQLVVPELADWCAVQVPRPDGSIELTSLAHQDPARIELARSLGERHPASVSDRGGVGEVLRNGEARLIEVSEEMVEDAAQDPHDLELLRELDLGSVMILPMKVTGATVGAMVLANQSDRRPFDEFDRGLAEQMAARAAIAIENARLATERTDIARALQEGLLPPHLPEMAGWTAAALYRPAGAENEVGGDFYDALSFEGGQMLFIGDVAGRGAAAAALTALARYTLRTSGLVSGDARVALRLLNSALLEHRAASLCSVAIVVLRGDLPGRAEIAVAGHPKPLLVGRDGVREVDARGPMLGAFRDASWETVEVEVGDGEQLVIYTDGVTEARGAEQRFGVSRLRDQLLGATNPAAAIARVEAALDAFVGGELVDDAALLVLRREARAPAGAVADRAVA
jgi:PAS domain S-box-containing protein